ncbi:uncharacterized protein I303_108178 [Kwoniella dejecticola CBS 10117]|uniref:DNA repair protein Swi5/Sae3 n=1 Tax=Kwoniella dejecticola CBS 10117 TaxID=1296121 RepID=A0A1A5ZY43_9TREE|nr:uncharacterized protein I303_07496 [Kwoniella dejecticola CBS 10117]OBR82729.1 hypothetical protein I303_07496 [Kwoniella dejecticola CBS 10117]
MSQPTSPSSSSLFTPNAKLPETEIETSDQAELRPPAKVEAQPQAKAKDSKQDRIDKLKIELQELKGQLGDNDANQVVQNHIKLLHEYNEIKDATQALIGKYGQITGRTVGDIHVEMGLPLTD